MDGSHARGRIEALRNGPALVLVGIGGHGGAGKTTLAQSVADAAIVSTDEFWDGNEFELTRLRREVLDPLARREPASFASFDWIAQRPRGSRTVAPEGIVIVEGVCALHRLFRDDYDLRIWVETPREVRLARGLARDGKGARKQWETVWMPGEDRYVAHDDPVSAADLIIDGTL